MAENIESIFENKATMMRKLKKKGYEEFMESFREEHGHFFDDMLQQLKGADEQEKVARGIGSEFANRIFEAFAKKGKVRGAVMADLNLFMIYYVFPAIQLTEDEGAKTLCDGIRDAWNDRFGDHINYTDYDKIYDSFREKIFGIL